MIKIWLFLISFSFSFASWSQITVKVGGYFFPPFVWKEQSPHTGLTVQLINLINSLQNKYHFVFVRTSSKRRYRDFKKGRFDVMFFEDKHWGWQKYAVDNTSTFLKGGEVYIAKKKAGRTQQFFTDFKGKSIRGYLGYHYALVNYETDKDILLKKYNMVVTRSHLGNIRSVLKERADIAIVSKAYLDNYFRKYPQDRDKILISQKMDQVYNHAILFRRQGNIAKEELEHIIKLFTHSNRFRQIIPSSAIKLVLEYNNRN